MMEKSKDYNDGFFDGMKKNAELNNFLWEDLMNKLKMLPHKVDSMGKIGELKITNNDRDGFTEGDYWFFAYIGEDGLPIESRYDKSSNVYLCSYERGFEHSLDDILDRLKKGGHING